MSNYFDLLFSFNYLCYAHVTRYIFLACFSRFGDIATDRCKMATFYTPFYITTLQENCSKYFLDFCYNQARLKPSLPDSGKLFCLCTAHTCHRQTDGQTDRPIDRRKSDPNSEVFIIMKYLLKSLTLIYLFMLFIDLFLCTYLFQYFFSQCQKLYKSICICKNKSNQT